MKDFKIDNKGSKTVFRNRWMERLTRTHFAVPVTLYYVIGLGCLGYSAGLPVIDLASDWWLFPVGLFSFTLLEYFIHRFVFHFHTASEFEEKLQYYMHGIHHEFPRDKDRLVMPPVMSVVIAFLFWGIFRFTFGVQGWILFGGFISGYSTYLVIHYALHAMRPPANFLKYLWKHHSLHHYSEKGAAYAVSMPLWDYVFGTMPDVKVVHDKTRQPSF